MVSSIRLKKKQTKSNLSPQNFPKLQAMQGNSAGFQTKKTKQTETLQKLK